MKWTVALLPLLFATASHADEATAIRRVGLGYKIGNGIGFTGADVIINPMPHLVLDLHSAYFTLETVNDTSTGFALAPAIQGELRAQGSTPYAAVGLQYVHISVGEVTASGKGFFANLGYEWKWPSGLGILLGGGIQHLNEIEAHDATHAIKTGGKTAPNLEFGVRYMFF